jgi:ATP/maltotriose-dependent transcriptional regulator MalT
MAAVGAECTFAIIGRPVEAEAGSIYRKLGASTRSHAVTRARELGLLEG